MVADPLSVAGLGLGAVSLAIQLADGLRKGFIFVENASRASEDSKAFAVRLVLEHQRFSTWTDLSGLSEVVEAENEQSYRDATEQAKKAGREGVGSDKEQSGKSAVERAMKARKDFGRFLKYTGPVIVPILLEMNMVISQLSNSADRYSEFIETQEPEDADQKPSNTPAPDVAEPPELVNTQAMVAKVASLSATTKSIKTPAFVKSQTEPKQQKAGQHSQNMIKRLFRTGKKAANMKSIRWVIHDAEACAQKIERVRELNAFLHESLGHVNRDKQIERDSRFQDVLLRLEDKLSLMRAFPEPPTTAGEGEDNASILTGSTAVDHPFKNDFIRQASRFQLAAIDQASQPDVGISTDEAAIGAIEYSNWLDQKFRQMAKLLPDGRRIWVEWRPYTEVNLAASSDPPRFGVDPELVKRMDRLVSLLRIKDKPAAFCVPPCLGYLFNEDENKVGILYEAPERAPSQTPRSLFSYLGKVDISLSQRVRFAKVLAEWLLHLHSVRWLHKGIESASVVFFPTDDVQSLENPYITGFSYARTASTDPAKRTTKPPYAPPHIYYVHPDYQDPVNNEGYRKVYDIYSLGIILIELAYWQPIETILRTSLNRDAASEANHGTGVGLRPLIAAAEGRRLVSENHPILDHLRTLVGDRYCEVVRACVQGLSAFGLPADAPEADTEVSASLLDAFGRIVVEPLQDIVV